MTELIQSVKGTRDFYPQDWAFIKWFYEQVKEVSLLFGFEEYEGPILERLELYAAKSGEEIVKKQAFTLTDRSGETLALRPEMTPSLARMIAQKSGQLVFPAKWFSFGRRFRYEKPQRGRGREFFQTEFDILGLDNLEVDAEVIAIAATIYQKLGLTPKEVRIKINDRQLLREKVLSTGVEEEKLVEIFRIIDKKNKVSPEALLEMLNQTGTTDEQAQTILQILSEKNLYLDSPWLTKIFKLLKEYGVADYVEYDPTIVRGLEYYTRTVFEGWDIKGQFRSIWGGGRYDSLTAQVGGREKIPGVGFAMGDMVIAEVLKANNKYPEFKVNKTQVLVTVFNPELFGQSLLIADKLRNNGINTEIYLVPEASLNKQIRYADRKNIPQVIILGPDETKNGQATLKDLLSGRQETLTVEELVKKLHD